MTALLIQSQVNQLADHPKFNIILEGEAAIITMPMSLGQWVTPLSPAPLPFVPRAAEPFAGARKLHFYRLKINDKVAPLLETTGTVVLKVPRSCLVWCLRSINDVMRHAFVCEDKRYLGLVR